MAPNVVTKPEFIALLSTASLTESGGSGDFGGALHFVAGESLLGWQMLALYEAGVGTFLIEVDSIPGGLLNLADRFRQRGARVELLRSAQDLQSFLKPGGHLVIQAEAHYISASKVKELIQHSAPFVATVDGRDENAAFERIDLNTRWAGFAVLNTAIAQSMAELPEGWSIGSSLLRHAIQKGTTFHPVAQASIQNGDIVQISTSADGNRIVKQMLDERTGKPSGFIEKHLFGAIAKKISPTIWNIRRGEAIVGASCTMSGLASVGLAMIGWNASAAAAALFMIFLLTLSGVTTGFGEGRIWASGAKRAFWSVLMLAAFAASWTSTDNNSSDVIASMSVLVGLAIISSKLELPRWSAGLLKSPAMLGAAIFVSAVLSVFALGVKMITLVQLGLLIASLYLPDLKRRNSNQA